MNFVEMKQTITAIEIVDVFAIILLILLIVLSENKDRIRSFIVSMIMCIDIQLILTTRNDLLYVLCYIILALGSGLLVINAAKDLDFESFDKCKKE